MKDNTKIKNFFESEDAVDFLKDCERNLYMIGDRLSYGESGKYPTIAEEIHVRGIDIAEQLTRIADALESINHNINPNAEADEDD